MTVEEKLKLIDQKLDLLFQAILVVPFYTKAMHDKNPRAEWNKAVRETRLLAKKYDEVLKTQNENTNNFTRKQD
jgi:hypothetical protein